jgi:hypothetical protein
MSATDVMEYTPSAEPAQNEARTLPKAGGANFFKSIFTPEQEAANQARTDLAVAAMESKDCFNAMAVTMGDKNVAIFKKLRFEHKYKHLSEDAKEAQYLLDIVEEFRFEAQDTARLHQLRTAAAARQFEAIQALPKFGVGTYTDTKETDPILAEKAIRAWAYLLEGRDGEQALREARKELDGIVEDAARLPPLPPRQGARLCLGISLADEQLVLELDHRLSKPQQLQAYDDARDRGAKFAECSADNASLGRYMLDAWFELLMAAADEDARQVLRDAIRAHVAGNPPPSPGTPPKISRQPGFKGTPEQPLPPAAPVPAPAPAEQTPPPLELPPMTRTHAVPQTEWAFQEEPEAPAPPAPAPSPEPAEQTPDAKPAPEAPPAVQHPALTVNVEAATDGNHAAVTASKNLEAALNAAEEKPREWDLSITYIRCPPGHHFIDDEGHIAPNKKKRLRADWQREGVHNLTGRDIKFRALNEEETYFSGKVLKDDGEDFIEVEYEDWQNGGKKLVEMIAHKRLYSVYPCRDKWPAAPPSLGAPTHVDHELNEEAGTTCASEPPAKVPRTIQTRALKTKISDY